MARRRQTELPGTEPKRIKEVEEAAESFRELRDQVKKLTEERDKAKETLGDAMKKHKLEVYRLEDTDPPEEVVIEVAHEEVKIRKVKGASSDD